MTTDCGSCPAELRPEWIMLKLRHDTRPGTLESGDTAPVIISGENSVIAKPRSESQDQDLVSWLLTELVIRQIIMVWSHRATWTYPKPGRAGARWQLAWVRLRLAQDAILHLLLSSPGLHSHFSPADIWSRVRAVCRCLSISSGAGKHFVTFMAKLKLFYKVPTPTSPPHNNISIIARP